MVALGGKFKAVYSETDGYLTKAQIEEMLASGAEVYVCGPTTFMEQVIENLVELGVASDKIHYEFFGAAMALQIKTTA